MQVAFYRGASGTLVDKIIASHDKGRFSHAELVFDRLHGEPERLCFSSSYRDGGTRFKRIDLGDGKWELVDVPMLPDAEAAVMEWCRGQQGKAYDLIGVLAFKLPFRQDGARWFCSEVSAAALQQVGLLQGEKPHELSPNALYWLLTTGWGRSLY